MGTKRTETHAMKHAIRQELLRIKGEAMESLKNHVMHGDDATVMLAVPRPMGKGGRKRLAWAGSPLGEPISEDMCEGRVITWCRFDGQEVVQWCNKMIKENA